MNIHKALIDFWEDQTPDNTEIHFSPKGIEEASADDVESFNKLLRHLKDVGFDSKVGTNGVLRVWWPHPTNPRPNSAEYPIQSHVFQGTPDARLATKGMATATGPFRRRYRALSNDEVQHHDNIKDVATELWNLIEGIPGVRDAHLDDVDTQNVVRRDMALARTALEDTVMRAVRALTA